MIGRFWIAFEAIDWPDIERGVHGLRLGLLTDAGWGAPVEPEVRAAIEAAAEAFEAAGASVTRRCA